MATEDEASGWGAFLTEVLKAVAVIISLPLLPIAVAFNVKRIANRLSELPGISKGGGLVSGIFTLVYVAVLIGVLASGATAATGGSLPVVGSEDSISTPTATPTEVLTPTSIPTATPTAPPTVTPTETATLTATPSAAERRRMDLEEFEEDYRQYLDKTFDEPDIQDTQYLATEYVENDDGELVFWVVFWECRNQGVRDQRFTIAVDFANTVGNHDGAQPDRIRFYGVSDFVPIEDSTAYVTTKEAEAWVAEEIDGKTYHRNWIDRFRDATDAENETAYQLVVDDGGEFLADKAWGEEEDEPGGCPGRQDVHPNNERDDA